MGNKLGDSTKAGKGDESDGKNRHNTIAACIPEVARLAPQPVSFHFSVVH